MMLAHEIFDPEHNKRVLVNHAFIVAGGDISQIMLIDRDDIVNLYVVTNLPLPAAAKPTTPDPWTEDPHF